MQRIILVLAILFETLRLGDLEAWRLGDFETLRLGGLETWRLGDLGDKESLKNKKSHKYRNKSMYLWLLQYNKSN